MIMDTEGGYVPGRCTVVDLNRGKIAVRVAGHIANNRERPWPDLCAGGYKDWCARTREDAVKKDVVRETLGARSARGCFSHVPFRCRNTHGLTQIGGTGTHAA